jgi:hypothetical protein
MSPEKLALVRQADRQRHVSNTLAANSEENSKYMPRIIDDDSENTEVDFASDSDCSTYTEEESSNSVCEDEKNEKQDVREDQPPEDFEINNPAAKKIDSDAYWRANRRSIPSRTPCCVCNEVVTSGEMSKIVYDKKAPLFDPLFPGTNRSQRNYNTVNSKKVLACTDSEGLRVCKRCENKLRTKKIPIMALKNGLDFGEVPQELQNLTMTEQRMISICNSITTFVKIGHGATSQMATIGGIAYLTNDITEYTKILPRPPSLSRIVYIRILKNIRAGESGPRSYTKFEIRPDNIRNALNWLKANNPLYADIKLDFRYLDDWASEEVVVHDIIETPSLPEVLQ